MRRLSAAPRKAKCLERKSTAPIYKQKKTVNKLEDLFKFIYSLQLFKKQNPRLVRQRMLKRINHSLCPVLDLKLAEDIADMRLHCL
ncbi:hypothetical protein B9K06_10385 [Bacillus sp. OG2]|nr:hypothetical protein B9K06_10385 [Bacillus sp. OG2]